MNKLLLNKRLNIFIVLIILLFLVLIIYMCNGFINMHDYYNKKLDSLTNVLVYGNSYPRGRIYDRNYNLLVDNKSVLTITYKKVKLSKKEEINLLTNVIKHLELNYDKVSDRNLREYYLYLYGDKINNKITKEEYEQYKERKLNNNDLFNLKISRITDDELNTLDDNDKRCAYLYYLMNNGYSYNEKIIKTNVSDNEYAYFSEHLGEFPGFKTKINWERFYPYGDTFKSILGNIGNIPLELKDNYLSLNYSLDDVVGLNNIEYEYEKYLRGEKNVYKKISNNNIELVKEGSRGNDIVLTIDINLQKEIDNIIDKNLIRAKSEANTKYLNKSYVIIQDPTTGEILAISGRQVIKSGNDYLTHDITPFALTDPMTPGSVVKGASMIVGYNTGNIKIGDSKTDECVKLYNFPKKCSSTRYGRLNDINALAYSSNVYQFKIAMGVAGINYAYNIKAAVTKDAFDIYRNTFKQFGLGVKTEIDLPVESLGYSGKTISPDLLLNYAIGQYDSYTPIQLSQYITTIASNGERIKPHLLKEVRLSSDNNILDNKVIYSEKKNVLNKVDTKDEYIKRIQEGFIAVMDYGYGKNVMGNSPNPAGKTGTSESFIDTDNDGKIDTQTISNSFVGYAPYDNPKMTITVTSPDVEDPNTNINFRTYMNRRIAKEVSNKYFEIYD